MASNQTKGLWRSRIERLLATDMSVAEWCAANKVSESATYVWLGRFADADPELFGGEQNIADRNQSKWVTRTRDNMRASSAPIVPAGKDGGFRAHRRRRARVFWRRRRPGPAPHGSHNRLDRPCHRERSGEQRLG